MSKIINSSGSINPGLVIKTDLPFIKFSRDSFPILTFSQTMEFLSSVAKPIFPDTGFLWRLSIPQQFPAFQKACGDNVFVVTTLLDKEISNGTNPGNLLKTPEKLKWLENASLVNATNTTFISNDRILLGEACRLDGLIVTTDQQVFGMAIGLGLLGSVYQLSVEQFEKYYLDKVTFLREFKNKIFSIR